MNKSGNKIYAEGASALKEALRANATLTTLRLGSEKQQQDNAKQERTINSKEQSRQRILC